MIPASTSRVELNTADEINRARQAEIDESLRYHAKHPDKIGLRLEALEREWDIERAIEANAAAFSLAGLGLAVLVDRRFAFLSVAVGAFLLQHAIQGWCPPIPVMRRLGFRTPSEIHRERWGLKLLRGETPCPADAVSPGGEAVVAYVAEISAPAASLR